MPVFTTTACVPGGCGNRVSQRTRICWRNSNRTRPKVMPVWPRVALTSCMPLAPLPIPTAWCSKTSAGTMANCDFNCWMPPLSMTLLGARQTVPNRCSQSAAQAAGPLAGNWAAGLALICMGDQLKRHAARRPARPGSVCRSSRQQRSTRRCAAMSMSASGWNSCVATRLTRFGRIEDMALGALIGQLRAESSTDHLANQGFNPMQGPDAGYSDEAC